MAIEPDATLRVTAVEPPLVLTRAPKRRRPFRWPQPRPVAVTDEVLVEVDFVTRQRVAEALAESTDDPLQLDPEGSDG